MNLLTTPIVIASIGIPVIFFGAVPLIEQKAEVQFQQLRELQEARYELVKSIQ